MRSACASTCTEMKSACRPVGMAAVAPQPPGDGSRCAPGLVYVASGQHAWRAQTARQATQCSSTGISGKRQSGSCFIRLSNASAASADLARLNR